LSSAERISVVVRVRKRSDTYFFLERCPLNDEFQTFSKVCNSMYHSIIIIHWTLNFMGRAIQEKRWEGIIPRWKNNGRELFLGGKSMGGNYS